MARPSLVSINNLFDAIIVSMDRADCLIFIKNEERTENILSIDFDNKTKVYAIRFRNNDMTIYHFRNSDIQIHTPEVLNPLYHSVFYKGSQFSGLTGLYHYEKAGYFYLVKGDRHWLIRNKDIKISHSVLEDKASADVLAYLKELSFINPIQDEEGFRILSKRYNNIDFVPDDSVFSMYLSGKSIQSDRHLSPSVIIFPFGCNKSQKRAVENALVNKLSIIQGPPGTGKTQTILTIIANLLLQKKTAEIVSNNNSAVDNVREKLESYGLDFLLAALGSAENKSRFIASQTGIYPDIKEWNLSPEEIKQKIEKVNTLSRELDEYFDAQERRQKRLSEVNCLDTEISHFAELMKDFGYVFPSFEAVDGNSEEIVGYIRKYNMYFSRHDCFSFFYRIAVVFINKQLTWKASGWKSDRILSFLQWKYYKVRKKELHDEIASLEDVLSSFSMDSKLKELSELSMDVLKAVLFLRFHECNTRQVFSDDDFWKNPESIIAEYPIVTSTTFSAMTTLRSAKYDYVIIDEASQCDIASGALSLLSAKNAVIVGDEKQLQNIVTDEDCKYANGIFHKYILSNAYNYSENSFLSSIRMLFPQFPSVLLNEHYRCQPKIIGFCNEKFYDSKLVVMTADRSLPDEIMLYLTAPGYHSREHANLRQAEVIANEILPEISTKTNDIGIITPYHNNVKLIKDMINRDDIPVATIHSFQGREMDTIIFATSDDIVTDFSDSAMLINVAVSRAKNHFILVSSSEPQPASSNMHDLISYISYNSFKTINSSIVSVFDLLYEHMTSARMEFLATHRRVSEYDSENLMYATLENILSDPIYKKSSFRIVCHYPLRYLFRDSSYMTEEERTYLSKSGTHVDFLIYRAIGKEAVVAIEVDGFRYHKRGSRQYERDQMKTSIFSKTGLTLLRFKTNGSGGEKIIRNFLNSYISG